MKNKFTLLAAVLFGLITNLLKAQTPLCDTIPLEYLENQITFQQNWFMWADSSIHIPIVNHSDKGFAYPMAKLVNVTPLPDGMTYHVNSANWEVFASAYNPGDTIGPFFNFYVTQAIPVDYTVTFVMYVNNLSPLPYDTCIFEKEFTVNLNPSQTVGISEFKKDEALKMFPNPAINAVTISFTEVDLGKSFQIMDVSGRVVLTQKVDMEIIRIDCEQLSSGMYFVKTEESNRLNQLVIAR